MELRVGSVMPFRLSFIINSLFSNLWPFHSSCIFHRSEIKGNLTCSVFQLVPSCFTVCRSRNFLQNCMRSYFVVAIPEI